MGDITNGLNWLNHNPALGMIITVAIAGASAASALVIRKKKRKTDCKPILIFAEEIEQGTPSYNRALYVKNTGKGLALNIVRKIENEPLVLGSLAPGEKAFAYSRTLPSNSGVPILDNPQFHAALECDDVLGGHYEFTYSNRTQSGANPIRRRKMLPNEANRI